MYGRVMDSQEKVMHILNREREGKKLFFTIYKQEKKAVQSPLKGGLQSGQELYSNISHMHLRNMM